MDKNNLSTNPIGISWTLLNGGMGRPRSLTKEYFQARARQFSGNPIVQVLISLLGPHADISGLASIHLLHTVGGSVRCSVRHSVSSLYSTARVFQIVCGWESKSVLLQTSDWEVFRASLMNLNEAVAIIRPNTQWDTQRPASSSTPANPSSGGRGRLM